ncbi:hypothetical protein B566_EDAN007020 [Ephemera danica]|nr:hypothetical protein B566_EDAN007020 [Ephemera danica]
MMGDESWRDNTVAKRNLHLLDSEFMTDCTFVVGITEKKQLRCHKYILSHASSVFCAMFNGGLEEKGDVKVEDIEPQHFRKILEYIYSDHTKLENVETALCVCYAANKYMINTLILKCIDFIKKNLDPDIVCRALEFARLIDNADLEAKSLEYMQTHTSDVLQSASFPNAERATLLTILSQDTLYIASEVEVFSACIRWAKSHKRAKDKLRDVLGTKVFSLIRFLTMTCEEFATNVIPSKLLQLQESCDLMCCIATKSGYMPEGFNINTKLRADFGSKESIEIHTYNVYSHAASTLMYSYPFNFSVNVEAFIFGLQLRGLSDGSATVKDRFTVDLLSASNFLTSAKFEGLMSSDKSVEIMFKKPFLLKTNVNYTLKMTYSNVNMSYSATQRYQNEYNTNAGVKINANFEYTTISKIYIAKRISVR